MVFLNSFSYVIHLNCLHGKTNYYIKTASLNGDDKYLGVIFVTATERGILHIQFSTRNIAYINFGQIKLPKRLLFLKTNQIDLAIIVKWFIDVVNKNAFNIIKRCNLPHIYRVR